MNKKHKAIIIDDEESARSILTNLLLNFCPQIDVIDNFEDLETGVEAIKNLHPDLVFLDIEMPNYAGYEITSFFEKIDFEIIFVTAYDHYAIKAFEVSALDYLLKPIDIERLKKAVERFEKKEKSKDQSRNYEVLIESLKTPSISKIIVPIHGSQKIVDLNDIVAIEANESYSTIHTIDKGKYVFSKNLKHFEDLLENNTNFIRTHKSWIINSNFLLKYSRSNLSIDLEAGIVAKLSKYKKDQFEAIITK